MTQKRFITLQGDPVDGNLITKFTNAADFPAAVGHVGLTYVFADAMKPVTKSGPEITDETMVMNSVIHTAIDLFLWRFLEKMTANRNKLEGKCIDTAPDKDTPPTTAKFGMAAKSMRDWHLQLGLICGAVDSAFIVYNGMTDASNFGPYIMKKATASLIFYTRMTTGYHRFNKVVNGDWQIVDMPTPEKLAELSKTPEKKQGFNLFPKPN